MRIPPQMKYIHYIIQKNQCQVPRGQIQTHDWYGGTNELTIKHAYLLCSLMNSTPRCSKKQVPNEQKLHYK